LKILDFGLAKAIPKEETERQKVRMTGETGSIRYMAPEVALHKPYDEKADIFSWSFIVWEMATLTKPFEGYTKHDFFTNVVRGGERPPLNKRWPKEFAELLQACWDPTPSKRPAMVAVCEALKVRGHAGREGEGGVCFLVHVYCRV
jgi:serine/threonine protein kinase